MAIEYIRPDGDNFLQWQALHGGQHFVEVNEAVKDDDATYIFTVVAWKEETFNLSNTVAIGVGDTINSVTLRCYARGTVVNENIRNHIVAGGNFYFGAQVAVTTAYTLVSDVWVNNPDTAAPWTKADLDALIAGTFSRGVNNELRCTQLFVEIDYTPAVVVTGGGIGTGGSVMAMASVMQQFLNLKEKKRRKLISIMVKTMAKRKTMKGRASVYLRYQDKLRQLD